MVVIALICGLLWIFQARKVLCVHFRQQYVILILGLFLHLSMLPSSASGSCVMQRWIYRVRRAECALWWFGSRLVNPCVAFGVRSSHRPSQTRVPLFLLRKWVLVIMVVLLGKLIDGNDGMPLILIDVIKNTDLEWWLKISKRKHSKLEKGMILLKLFSNI